jgi:ribosomal protein S18 acetylase RimI-like enzyme
MIRKAKAEDSSRIADIQVFGWRNAYRGIIDDQILFTKLNIEKKSQNIRKVLEEGKEEWYVYEEESIIKGMMIIGKSRDNDKLESFELWALYVDPLMMRQGIGSQMVLYCENEAREKGFKENVLWVLEKNKIGIGFYEKNGYRKDGKVQEIEKLKATEIRYRKEL